MQFNIPFLVWNLSLYTLRIHKQLWNIEFTVAFPFVSNCTSPRQPASTSAVGSICCQKSDGRFVLHYKPEQFRWYKCVCAYTVAGEHICMCVRMCVCLWVDNKNIHFHLNHSRHRTLIYESRWEAALQGTHTHTDPLIKLSLMEWWCLIMPRSTVSTLTHKDE